MGLFNRKNRQLAIVFDDYMIRFVEATIVDRKIAEIHHVSVVDNDLIEDGSLNREKWQDLLKKQLQNYNIKAKLVKVVMPTSLVILRQQIMPDLPIKDQKQIIQLEIGNTIHLPFSEPVFDIVKMKAEKPIYDEEGRPAVGVALVAAPGSFIYPLTDGLRKSGLKPKLIDIPALSQYSLFSYLHDDLKENVLLFVYITRFGVDLHILNQGILAFTRHISKDITHLINHENDNIYSSLSLDLGEEIRRTIYFFQYTLDNRDKKIESCWVTTTVDLPEVFYSFLKDRIEMEVKSLTCKDHEGIKQSGYDLGYGVLLKEGLDKDEN